MSINIEINQMILVFIYAILFNYLRAYDLHKCNHLGYKMIHTFALTSLKHSIKTEPNINSKGQIKTY